jgi:uncharacterized protein (DUF362 family)
VVSNSSSRVVLQRVDDPSRIYDCLTQAFDALKVQIPNRKRIIIKPNLCDLRGSQSGITTDIQVVDALIRLLNERFDPKKISIVESNSTFRLAKEAFSTLGYSSLPEKYENVTLLNLTTSKSVMLLLPHPKYIKSLRLPRVFLEYEYFITVPKLKAMFPTTISVALKNQFGCLPTRYKAKYHPYLDNIITNINLLIHPDLCVVDGLIGADVVPRKLGLLLLSIDPVAVDTVAAQIMGFSPRKIGHLRLCDQMGVGTMRDIETIFNSNKSGDTALVQEKFKYPPLFFRWLGVLGYHLIRTAHRLERTGESMIALTTVSGIPLRFSRFDILRNIGNAHAWKSFFQMYKKAHIPKSDDYR